MYGKPTLGPRGRRGVLTAATTACALLGTTLLTLDLTSSSEPPPVPKDAVRAPARPSNPSVGERPRGERGTLTQSPPTRVEIPAIGLGTDVKRVALNTAGAIAMPSDADHTGWYTGSPSPGSQGNSILVGHLDSRSGPAAFYGLGAVEEGDRITIDRADGRTATYVVDSMTIWPKDDFPSQRVYGPTPEPRLTLLTCADWDDGNETYRSNLIVNAHLKLVEGNAT
ncbi:sortase domain-bontaining protein [Streptomyces oceani]|uniref:Peptidase C60 n=1 Tax=Streptomyces oceani TaxID=1075402 RepID=A0A1E7KJT0_9ACTN|nr:sortase [Streptomyces oceani]OEV04170.1 hypothetical protein AN216_08145 [Streptomyces oceani]